MKINPAIHMKVLAFMLGLSCFIVQLVLLREFMNLFIGNELIIGIVLALWMLLSGTGALIGKYAYQAVNHQKAIFLLLGLNAIFPLAGIFFSVYLKSMFFVPGVMVSLQGTLLISLSGLAAFCLVSGMLFTMLAGALSSIDKTNQVSRIYSLEALGGLVGGILFNFILIYTFNSLRILSILMILNLLISIYFGYSQNMKSSAVIGLIITALISIPVCMYQPDNIISRMLFPGQKILHIQDTPFGKIVISENAGQVNYFYNGNPFGFSEDIIDREEKVHYALCLHPSPTHVLMLSGGMNGAIQEALKYKNVQIDYVDPDPMARSTIEKYRPGIFPMGIEIFDTDPIIFFRANVKKYDVILMNLPQPKTIGNNRFYTNDFMALACSSLPDNGILSISLESGGNYLSEETRYLFSSIYNTLDTLFAYIRVVAGQKTYFIASNTPLSGDITRIIHQKGIKTTYVNEGYLDDHLMDARAVKIINEIDNTVGPNTDFRPLSAFLAIQYWLNMFGVAIWIIIIIPLLLMLFIIIRLSPVNLGLFTSGFSAAAAEFLLLIGFQIVYGLVYQMAGLIIMIFMAGLALGSGYAYKYFAQSKKAFISIQVLIALIMCTLPLVLIFIKDTEILMLPGLIIGMLTFVTALFTGIQYRLGTKLRPGTNASIAATTYSADLAGSAFGIFFIAIFIYPLAGLLYTCLLLAGFNFIVAGVVWWRR